ncbi:sporulation protein YunB [Pontibacillus salicampi]|uniref:Sporulation protein YunB n=1 Tax=Pontibacillus salicampi TaxID=1449801 RepID=A0ABV6LNN3_9BACI
MRKYKGSHKPMAPPPPGQIVFITFLFFIVSTFGSLWFINRSIEPKIMEIAQFKTEQLARKAIIEAVNKKVAEDLDPREMVNIDKDSEGNPVFVTWNPVTINKVQRDTYFRVQQYLERLENGEPVDSSLDIDINEEEKSTQEEVKEKPTLTTIPLGQATNNALLANLGPEIPVHFQTIGDVETNVIKKFHEWGINNLAFEVNVQVEVRLRIVLPFSTETTHVKTDILVAKNSIQGKVPYFNGGSGSGGIDPSIEIPSGPLSSP